MNIDPFTQFTGSLSRRAARKLKKEHVAIYGRPKRWFVKKAHRKKDKARFNWYIDQHIARYEARSVRDYEKRIWF